MLFTVYEILTQVKSLQAAAQRKGGKALSAASSPSTQLNSVVVLTETSDSTQAFIQRCMFTMTSCDPPSLTGFVLQRQSRTKTNVVLQK